MGKSEKVILRCNKVSKIYKSGIQQTKALSEVSLSFNEAKCFSPAYIIAVYNLRVRSMKSEQKQRTMRHYQLWVFNLRMITNKHLSQLVAGEDGYI